MAKLEGRVLRCERAQRSWTFGNDEQMRKHMTPEFMAEVERNDVAPPPPPVPPVSDPAPIATRDEARTALQKVLDWIV